jgi:hypothetical protein
MDIESWMIGKGPGNPCGQAGSEPQDHKSAQGQSLRHRRLMSILPRSLFALCLLTATLPLAGQQGTEPLPNAPVPATRPNTPYAVNKRRWEGIIEPGEKVPPLTPVDKLLFPVHEELRPLSLVPVLISGGYGVLRNSDPKLGTNSTAFGERVGEAALRQGSIRFFADGLLPVLFHEDPRYYRLTYGSYGVRTEYAVRRVFIDARNSGRHGFNFSDTLGRGMAAALTQAYYPEASIHPSVVFRTWGVSLAGSAGVNIFQEFWPDVKVKLFKQHEP